MRKPLHTRQYRQFIALLREARKAAGLTQAQIAKAVGHPQSFVAKYENGERRLDVVEFLEIATALKADPVVLIKRVMAGSK